MHAGLCSGPIYIKMRPNSNSDVHYVNLGPWYKHLRTLFPLQ
jgi:hypothetical protein